jgi:hypothetical protein
MLRAILLCASYGLAVASRPHLADTFVHEQVNYMHGYGRCFQQKFVQALRKTQVVKIHVEQIQGHHL